MEPAQVLDLFHNRLSAGHVDRIGELFSFFAAFEYYRDVAVALGAPRLDEKAFRALLERHFASSRLLHEVCAYRPTRFRQRIMAQVSSVVFSRDCPGAPPNEAVATLVNELGRWKVRTYPGVFPGPLLPTRPLKASAATKGARNEQP